MSLGLCFWILMLIWLVFSGWSVGFQPKAWGGSLLMFVLLLLLGCAQFGAPIHG